VTTIALFIFNDVADTARPILSAGNVARPLFDVVGALFAVSFALATEGFQNATLTATDTSPD